MRITGSLVLAVTVLSCSVALAIDQPISGSKLQLKHSSTKESLTFVSKDPGFLFPAIGGPDDPQTVGALLEVVPSAGSAVSFGMPAGTGKPGWSGRAGTSPQVKFDNALAPGGISAIRVTLLKQGKQIKITGKSLGGMTIAPATTSMTLRLTIGTQRNCVRFGPATVRRADNSTFSAINAPASSLPDCSDASIGLPSGCVLSEFPTCGGECPGGDVCIGGFGNCFCAPPGP
ncbi:MAG TPA: hypothetical protein VGR62_21460 [Candidatus Binatia bacterium]|jgi:hypothetical protein|nr:hypothetical protein [Candidatus Binatia bacterium]